MSSPSDFTSSPVKHSPLLSILIHQFIPLIHCMLISSSFPICLSSSFPFLLFTHDHFYPMPTNKLDSNPLRRSQNPLVFLEVSGNPPPGPTFFAKPRIWAPWPSPVGNVAWWNPSAWKVWDSGTLGIDMRCLASLASLLFEIIRNKMGFGGTVFRL